LPNETDKEARKGTQKREFTSSFAHSLVKGPKFQYLWERGREG
jgi:hypothetical protein